MYPAYLQLNILRLKAHFELWSRYVTKFSNMNAQTDMKIFTAYRNVSFVTFRYIIWQNGELGQDEPFALHPNWRRWRDWEGQGSQSHHGSRGWIASKPIVSLCRNHPTACGKWTDFVGTPCIQLLPQLDWRPDSIIHSKHNSAPSAAGESCRK